MKTDRIRALKREPKSPEELFVYPITILADRYGGSYSHGKWTAWECKPEDIPEDAQGGDTECCNFWECYREDTATDAMAYIRFGGVIGLGATPNEAELDLRRQLFEKRKR